MCSGYCGGLPGLAAELSCSHSPCSVPAAPWCWPRWPAGSTHPKREQLQRVMLHHAGPSRRLVLGALTNLEELDLADTNLPGERRE